MSDIFNGFKYSIENNEVMVLRFTKRKATTVEIPNIIEDLPVTKISNDCFKDKKTIETVILPDTITSIGLSAFSGCTSLRTCLVSFEEQADKSNRDQLKSIL